MDGIAGLRLPALVLIHIAGENHLGMFPQGDFLFSPPGLSSIRGTLPSLAYTLTYFILGRGIT